MKKKYKIIIGIVLAVVCVAYGVSASLKPLPVQVETVTVSTLVDTFTAQGQVLPQKSVVLNATASGTVAGLPFKPGMAVGEGEVLIEVTPADPAELAIQKEQLRQQLAGAEYQYQQLFSARGQERQRAAREAAQSAYDLAVQQHDAAQAVEQELPGVYTQAQLAGLEAAVKEAKQAIAAVDAQGGAEADRDYYQTLIGSSRAQLAALEEEQQNEPLLAPFAGVVWELLTDEGAYITKNQPVIKLYRQGAMKIEVSMLSEDSLGLSDGQPAELSLSNDSRYDARISFISPVARQEVSSLGLKENRCTVELEPLDLPANLGAGHELDVLFSQLMAENVLSVPASAIVPLSGGSGVYVVQEGKARLISVTTGVKCGGRVEILSGLSAGDSVVIDPYDSGITEDSRVKVEKNI